MNTPTSQATIQNQRYYCIHPPFPIIIFLYRSISVSRISICCLLQLFYSDYYVIHFFFQFKKNEAWFLWEGRKTNSICFLLYVCSALICNLCLAGCCLFALHKQSFLFYELLNPFLNLLIQNH